MTTSMTHEQFMVVAGKASLAVEALQVNSDAAYESACKVVKLCKTYTKKLEAARVAEKAPYLTKGRDVDAAFSPAKVVFATCEKELKRKIAAWHEHIEAERIRHLPTIQQAHEAGDYQAAVAAANSVPEAPEAKGVSVSKAWAYEVEDANLVPRQFLAISDTSIRAAIKAGHREIPGLRIFERPQVRVTADKA